MKRVEKYVRFDDASRVKKEYDSRFMGECNFYFTRELDSHFTRKRPAKDRKGECNKKRLRREEGLRDEGNDRFD